MTLLELMIVIGLSGLFVGAVYETFIHGLRVVDAADERAEVQSELAWALDRLTRELAQAITFTTADSSQVIFSVDLNDDGTRETVEVALRSGRLVRKESGREVVVVRNAQAVSFSYLDVDGKTLSTPVAAGSLDDIRAVQLSVTGNLDQETVTVATAAFVRNLFSHGAT